MSWCGRARVRRSACACVLLLLLLVITVTAEKKTSIQSKQVSRVVELTDSTFFDSVINSTQAWMVMFYAPWCVHCQALKPEWVEAARTNGEWIGYGAVDCTTQTNLAKRFKVSSYPTVYTFPAGEKTPKSVSKYRGALKNRAISTHAATLLSAKLISRPHDIPTLQSFLTKRTPTHTKVLVFALPRDALSIWQALSQHVAAVADVAYIPKGNDKLESVFGVYRFPTIVVLRPPPPPPSVTSSSPYPGIVYHGDLSLTPIKHVITAYHESSQPHADGVHIDTYPRNKDIQYHIDRARATGTNTNTNTPSKTNNKVKHQESRTSTETSTPSLNSAPAAATLSTPAKSAHADAELCGLEPTPACSDDGQQLSTHADTDTSTATATATATAPPTSTASQHDTELCGLEPTPACSGDEASDGTSESSPPPSSIDTDTDTDTASPTEPPTPTTTTTSHDSELCGLEPTPACSGSEESSYHDHDSHSHHEEL